MFLHIPLWLCKVRLIGGQSLHVCLVSQLPRHKTVVVRLNASDDSDSEIDAPSSVQCVFGLESMIKEARRTAEVREPETEHQTQPERKIESETVLCLVLNQFLKTQS